MATKPTPNIIASRPFNVDYEGWLDGIVSLSEGAEMRGVSVDSLKRSSPDKFIRVSARRLGIRRRDALMKD